MISEKENKQISKFLSLVLRHQPEVIEIVVDESGWTDVNSLLQQMNNKGFPISLDTLKYVVTTNKKKRFSFNEDQTKIRANQGHSIAVTLGYMPSQPPPILYHGTAERNLSSILQGGLTKSSRQQVHLSSDEATAIQVGQRHGKPVVLQIAAENMSKDGFLFYLSDNEVWLTDYVPAAYLSIN